MSLRLPDPSDLDAALEPDAPGEHEASLESSNARARDADDGAGTGTADRRGAVNVAIQGNPDPDGVALTDEGYVGDAAGPTGRLAAALAVANDRDDVVVHCPDPDLTAEGPWLVLAPLSGVLTTVATGVGRAVVMVEYDADADPALSTLDSLVSALFDAARPTHEHYPVADDDLGVFTTGMTTFSLASVDVDVAGDADADVLEATFSVSTTPATTARAVEAQFDAVDAVRDVAYDPVAGVARACPSATLRDAVEAAHREVVGDAQYDWLPEGDVFARIPTCEKVAFGSGAPGDDAFTHEEYATCVALLEATLGSLQGERGARATE